MQLPAIHVQTMEVALRRHYRRACELLIRERDLIENVASRLMGEGKLSGRSLVALCREYGK